MSKNPLLPYVREAKEGLMRSPRPGRLVQAPAQCEHYGCRCARANELAVMAERTGDNTLLAQALEVHDQRVTCRRTTPDC